MKNLPNIWIGSLESFDEVIEQIELCLQILKENAAEANFLDQPTKVKYSNDVMYMKQFFERAETLLRY
jgi:hypothetical protein